MEKFNFTAIDFETMTPERTSACAIGIVRVENNVIVQKFYSLINPIPDERDMTNTHVHGITREMVGQAPTFKELWPSIQHYIDGQIVVCHNEDFDMDVLDKVCDFYGIEYALERCIDTMQITHLGLEESCAMAGIELGNHHDALCDATACAQVMLLCMGIRPQTFISQATPSKKSLQKRKMSSETKKPLNPEDVENKETPFFNQKIVLTGILTYYPEREEIAEILRRYGADINTSISRKTNIVIVGAGAGPSKMKKIQELQEDGCEIKVLNEQELLDIMDKFNIK